MIWINFKTYPQATGNRAVELARICFEVAQKTGVAILPVVQTTDLFRVYQALKKPLWAQHVEAKESGRQTGWVLPEGVIQAGARGTLVNHSEHKLEPAEAISAISFLRGKGLKTMVCCSSLAEGEQFAPSKPDYLVFEPPELIASRTASVSTAEPEMIAKFVKKFPEHQILIGAGIQDEKDIETGLKLGVKGFLVASAVATAVDPEAVLIRLAKSYQM